MSVMTSHFVFRPLENLHNWFFNLPTFHFRLNETLEGRLGLILTSIQLNCLLILAGWRTFAFLHRTLLMNHHFLGILRLLQSW